MSYSWNNSNNQVDGGAIVFGALVILSVIILVLIALAITIVVGAVFGSGHAIYNYAQAFYDNVGPER